MKGEGRMKRVFGFTTLCVLIIGLVIGAGSASADPWKFGVMSDTQWTAPTDPAGKNPNGVAVSIIKQINQQFINHGVKFVIQVGDLTEAGNDADIATRAAVAQQLYLAGIGFFPMRGNHETYANPPNNLGIPAVQANFPQTRGLQNLFGATNFSSPTSVSDDLNGMSYSFDYGTAGNNSRFVIIDNWATPSKSVAPGNGYNYGYSIGDQQAWIDSRLDRNSRGTEHAFVFSHQPVMAENHQDSPFTGYTDANPDMQNAFFASLQINDVKYYISGHDHIHQRSIVTSPNGAFKVQELVCASNSSKFYTPKSLTDAKWYGQKRAETSLSQERYTVGYYIFTIHGPLVTVDYYSDDHGNWQSDANYPNGQGLPDTGITPTFNFVKKETWGYSLNGQEFLIPQGQSYTSVIDSFGTTTARILSGTNDSTTEDYNNRPLTKVINTGWTDMDAWHSECFSRRFRKPEFDPVSNFLSLWGMTDFGTDQTDVYTLSMTYEGKETPFRLGRGGGLAIATKDESGHWVNAVDVNIGASTKRFVEGPWKVQYGLGTYGIDPKTHTAWAVIDYTGDFAVGNLGR
jgi:Calcineurin-like phosphoesterase